MSYTEKVVETRMGKGSALMFFSVQVGSTDAEGEFTPYRVLRNCILRKGGRHRSGYWIQFPQETRKRKNEAGQYVPVMETGKDGNEYEKRDNLFDNYGVRSGSGETAKFDTPKYVWATADALLEQAAALYNSASASESGRGAAKPANAPTKVTASAKSSPLTLDEEDDELPFS